MSNIIEYTKRITLDDLSVNGVATLDGEVLLSKALQLPMRDGVKVQVCAITISDRIPNVFNAYPFYQFDNTLLRVWTSSTVGAPVTIQLPRGLYGDSSQIADAINAVIAPLGWYANSTIPALSFGANSVTEKIIVTIDNSKMNSPTHQWLALDLRKTSTNTDMAYTLGYSEGVALFQGVAAARLIWESDILPRMDTQGTSCDVRCSLIPDRRRDDRFVDTLAIIPFAGKNTISDNVWPSSGQISPLLVYEGSKTINYASFRILTMEGRQMLFMAGGIHIIIAFSY